MDEKRRQEIRENTLKKFFRKAFSTEDIFWNNEVRGNMLVAFAMLVSAILLAVCCALNYAGVFASDKTVMLQATVEGLIELLVPHIVCIIFKGQKKWIKHLMLVAYVLAVARITTILSHNVSLAIVFPVVLSCRYCSEKFTRNTAIFTGIVFTAAAFSSAYFHLARYDLNFVNFAESATIITQKGEDFVSVFERQPEIIDSFDQFVYVRDMMLQEFMPRLALFVFISMICTKIAKNSHSLVLEQAEVAQKGARIESELSLATDIQANMLPRIFPAFPDHDEFDIYATMSPAKEVGGDFYDYFMVDDSHLACVIADVSGKGVPAALFMVIAKTLIKDHTQVGLAPAEVFTRVNRLLCEGNEADLFVTAWMCVIDLRSGEMTYVNAGHNPPLICKDGRFEYLKSRPGFVLAGLDSVKYKQGTVNIAPGDKLFLYTDGVTEATSADKKLYGETRLVNFLNANTDKGVVDMLSGVRGDIDSFVGEAEQFDDITMLVFEYKSNGGDGSVEKIFPAADTALDEARGFIEAECEAHDVSPKATMQLSVAFEELFVNVAHYGYPGRTGDVKVSIGISDNAVTLRLMDRGIPFDPLAKEDPDITLTAEEREIGGLGIYMVKKSMDSVEYDYRDGMNITTLKKSF